MPESPGPLRAFALGLLQLFAGFHTMYLLRGGSAALPPPKRSNLGGLAPSKHHAWRVTE
jgi:hypothetical protein